MEEKLFRKILTLTIIFLFIGASMPTINSISNGVTMVSHSIPFIEETIEDPEDDVILFEDPLNLDNWTKTDTRPNIDIVRVTYSREENSREATITLEVNSRGYIEDNNSFDYFNFTFYTVSYMIILETSTTLTMLSISIKIALLMERLL